MLLQSVQSNLIPYVTSSFAQHGLLATTGIVAAVLGGVSKLAIAKIIDIWGRVEGLAAMLFLIVIGMIMKATCQNVEMYAAAHTLYWVGHLGLTYIIDVVLADMTTLKNRAIMFGVNAFPTVATTFAGPAIAELFYERANFRWAFGAFCIILVVFCAPVGIIFFVNRRKSLAMGIAQRPPSGRNAWQSVKHYFIELDGEKPRLDVADCCAN
jgi:MFS family permease